MRSECISIISYIALVDANWIGKMKACVDVIGHARFGCWTKSTNLQTRWLLSEAWIFKDETLLLHDRIAVALCFRRCSFAFHWRSAFSGVNHLQLLSVATFPAAPIPGACVEYSTWCMSPRHQSFPFKCFDVHDCDWQFSWQSFFLIQIFAAATSTMILDTIGSSHPVLKLVHQRTGCSAWCGGVSRLPRSQSDTTRRRPGRGVATKTSFACDSVCLLWSLRSEKSRMSFVFIHQAPTPSSWPCPLCPPMQQANV